MDQPCIPDLDVQLAEARVVVLHDFGARKARRLPERAVEKSDNPAGSACPRGLLDPRVSRASTGTTTIQGKPLLGQSNRSNSAMLPLRTCVSVCTRQAR